MRECINLSGLKAYEIPIFKRRARMKNRDILTEVEEDSPRLRWHYCTFKCPYHQRCKFVNRYGERR